MWEWIEQNKEWLLSGVGVTIVLSVVSIVYSYITYKRNYNERKRLEKKLNIDISLKQYQIRARGKTSDLTVNYEGNSYKHLCEYSVSIFNNGLVAINQPKLLFAFPFDCLVIKTFDEKSSEFIHMDREVLKGIEKIEHLYEFDRLEPSDRVTIIYLVDTDKADELTCRPRGVDGVNCSYSQSGLTSQSDFAELWNYVSLYILAGTIPFSGRMLQSAVVMKAGPAASRLLRSLAPTDRAVKQSSVTIHDVSMQEGSNIDVRSKS